MKHLLTIISCFAVLSISAQVPGYMPTNGLIGWYPFNGSVVDESGNGNDGENFGAVSTVDRNGEVNSAFYFGMEAMIRLESLEDYDWGFAPSTVMAWANYQGLGDDNGVIIRYDDCASSYVWGITIHESPTELVFHDLNRNGVHDHSLIINPYSPSGWTHYAFVKDPITGSNKAYVNGELVGQINFAASFPPSGEGNPQLLIGSCGGWAHEFGGDIDDIAFFDRALSDEEISNIFNEQPLIYGCTEPSACNYDIDANANNSCEYVTCLCLDGTIWSQELGGCIPATTCPQDLDFDGVVGVNDLMNLLSAFGTPCEPSVAEWTCGDPVSYHSYDYETVLIGEQCWFAENLRTELYQNGDTISGNLDANSWMDTNLGAQSIYGEGGSNCYDQSYEQNSCDVNFTLNEYGRLYNWFAIDDSRGLCPSSWAVPSDEDFTELEIEVAAEGYNGEIGSALKSQTGWYEPGNGVDAFGFSALAGGSRAHFSGYFISVFTSGNFWSSTSNQEKSWARGLGYNSANFVRYEVDPNTGFSIRCIKD